MKKLLAAALAVCAAGCAGSRLDVIQVGPWFPSRNASEVEIFSSRSETSRPWGGIAVIHGERLPAGASGAIERQKAGARKLAAKAGADAVIVTVQPGSSGGPIGSEEPEVFLSALAIKYVEAVSTSTAR